MSEPNRGVLFVLSGPSGAGKSTLTHRLLDEIPSMRFSVSYTTRPPRANERDGRDYHFVDDATFDRMIEEGAFLEWAPVHGRRYGTAREATREILDRGDDLLLDIDVAGARQIRASDFEAVFVFIVPPDLETLERRLRARGSEDGTELDPRLATASEEVAEFSRYDYLIVNDDADRAFGDLRAVVRAERRRVGRCRGDAERILEKIPRPQE